MTYRKNFLVGVLALLASIAAAGLLILSAPRAQAATPPTEPLVWGTCGNLKSWAPNDDEKATRSPEATADGVRFSPSDLIHHATTGEVESLQHGTFALAAGSDAPDQPSFFSVEVANADAPYAYGTLRWNTVDSKWEMSSGGQYFEDESAVAVADHFGKSHRVISFGVGYTLNPPGTKTAVVDSVTFAGKTYPLTCKPEATTKPPASSSASNPHHVSTPNPPANGPQAGNGGSALAITGPSGWAVGAVAAGLGIAGGLTLIATRKRKTRFTA